MLWILTPILLGIIALAYTIAANLLRVWIDHRVKIALLEKLQRDPARAPSPEELRELLEGSAEGRERRDTVDFVIAGSALAAMGVASAFTAWCFGGGGWLTGAYLGGIVCVIVGFILALLGMVVRYLTRSPVEPIGG